MGQSTQKFKNQLRSEASVPAKVILFGEHAVVYPENHAIIWPVESLRATTKTYTHTQPDSYEVVYDGKVESHDFSDLGTAFEEFEDLRSYIKVCLVVAHDYVAQFKSPLSLRIELSINIPIGGFGSSASIAASLIKAITEANQMSLDQPTWYDLVMQAEKSPHGNPSGADAAAVTLQKPIIVRKRRDGLVDVQLLEATKDLENIVEGMQFFHTGRPQESTREVVQYVQGQDDYQTILADIEANTQHVVSALKNRKLTVEQWKKWININGELLEKLRIVPEKATKESRTLREKGGAVKLSGAGTVSGDSCGVMIYFGTDSPSF